MDPLILMGVAVLLSFGFFAVTRHDDNSFTDWSLFSGKPKDLDTHGDGNPDARDLTQGGTMPSTIAVAECGFWCTIVGKLVVTARTVRGLFTVGAFGAIGRWFFVPAPLVAGFIAGIVAVVILGIWQWWIIFLIGTIVGLSGIVRLVVWAAKKVTG